MTLELTTPALLFSTISLLMLAYTNRFLAVAKLIRELKDRYMNRPTALLMRQIKNLKLRIILIRNMQLLAIASLLLSAICMFMLFAQIDLLWPTLIFSGSLILLCVSLFFSVWEIYISANALRWEISELEIRNEGLLEKIIGLENPMKK